jgi:putative ABC transport system permease protein
MRVVRRPRLALALIGGLLPRAERAEVLGDLEAEYGRRRATRGGWAAARWLWGQVVRSLPSLVSRSTWRGFTGFESRANAVNPGGPLMERWILDARYAVRRLRTRPTYTALAVLTLALGVGGMTAISGIVRPILVDPLPYPEDRELAIFWSDGDWTASEVLALRNEWKGFTGVAAYHPEDVTVEVPGAPARFVPAIAASSELFHVLGRRPRLGRGFQAGEDAPGAAGVAVLSDAFWRELGADHAMVGRTLILGGQPRTVIGIMPPGFWFPDPSVRLWLSDALHPGEQNGMYALIGRAAGGRDARELIPNLSHAARILGAQFTYPPEWDKTKNPTLTTLREHLVGHMKPPLLATVGAMAVILLIACANVAALMLGQVESRSGELAVRAALGADRIRLTTQLLFEALALGLAGGIVGAAAAVGGFDVLRGALPLGDWVERARLDWTLFAVALAFAVLSALVVALFPALSLWRGDLRVVLAGMRTGGVVRARGGLQGLLVVGEVALAVLLACGAALLARSVDKLYAVWPGVDIKNVAVVDVVMPARFGTAEKRATLRELVREASTIPGVTVAAATQKLPLRGPGDTASLVIPGAPADARPTSHFRLVSPDYFRAMGIPLRQGRTFNLPPPQGRTPAEREVVVNETFVKTFLPGRDPLGQVIRGMGADDRIVGVVGDVAEQRLAEKKPPVRYYLADELDAFLEGQTLVLRSAPSVDPGAVVAEARRVVARAVPSVAIREAGTMQRVFDRAVGPAREVMTLLGLLTGLGLVLGAVGVYGVMAQYAARRTREWSIRTALGLGPWQLVGQVLGHGTSLIVGGIVAGVVGALALTRLLSSLLYGVGATDPVALGGAALVLLAVGVLATVIPAVRASRVSPALVLRLE